MVLFCTLWSTYTVGVGRSLGPSRVDHYGHIETNKIPIQFTVHFTLNFKSHQTQVGTSTWNEIIPAPNINKLCCHEIYQYRYAQWVLTFWTPKRLKTWIWSDWRRTSLYGRLEKVVCSLLTVIVFLSVDWYLLIYIHIYFVLFDFQFNN